MYADLHAKYDLKDKAACAEFVKTVCSKTDLWGEDLNNFADFASVVTDHLYAIETEGIIAETDKVLASAE